MNFAGPTHYLDQDTGEPVADATYEIHLEGGPVLSGQLDVAGQARHENVDNKTVTKVVYKPRPADEDPPHSPLDNLLA